MTLSTIRNAHLSGHFLDGAKESVISSNTDISIPVRTTPQLHCPISITVTSLQRMSPLHEDILSVMSSDAFRCIASLCKLLARSTDILSNSLMRAKRRQEYWSLLNSIITTVLDMAQAVEESWKMSLLADITDQTSIGAYPFSIQSEAIRDAIHRLQ